VLSVTPVELRYYPNLPSLSRVIYVVIAIAVYSDTATVTIRGWLILCIVIVNRIPTITATIAINPIDYAVEVNAVLLCNSVSIGGIVCLNEHQRSASKVAERIVLSEFKVAHNFSFS
jgi:hypothetical protein|tara:strand:+ start:536 stop:886 length:351 start_codon:yes stop_codon:yes gene_type:complete